MKEDQHHRHSIRLPKYDYSQEGWYFVTICVQNRECLFGFIENGAMRLNELGRIVYDELLKTPQIRPEILLDEFAVMPNHLHGIIVITDNVDKNVGAQFIAPITNDQSITPQNKFINQGAINCAPTLGHIIRYFKGGTAFVTRRTIPHFQWQRNYYEHIIRNEQTYWAIKEYIRNNPAHWEMDEENLSRQNTNIIL